MPHFQHVEGFYSDVRVSNRPGCFEKQTFTTLWRPLMYYGERAAICATIRFDDECKNGHNTFAITGEIVKVLADGTPSKSERNWLAGGCCHEEIARKFPTLAPLIKWHLTSSDGPMHYIANTLYHAGDLDHRGKRAGEPYAWAEAVQFGGNPIKHKLKSAKFWQWLQDTRQGVAGEFDYEVLPVAYDATSGSDYKFGPKYTFGGFADKWHECPFETEEQALDFLKALQTCSPAFVKIPTLFSEGKARELDHARSSAVWPEATDEQLSAPRAELEAVLTERHAALMASFKADIIAAGFQWEPQTVEA